LSRTKKITTFQETAEKCTEERPHRHIGVIDKQFKKEPSSLNSRDEKDSSGKNEKFGEG